MIEISIKNESGISYSLASVRPLGCHDR